MGDCLEVLFISDSSGKQKTAISLNPNVGTTLMTYRGSGAPKNCVSVVGNDYLISADSNKPILNVWPLNSQEPSQEFRMVIAGKPSALSVSPDGHFCIAAINSKIYIWNISSGALLNVVSRHYQEISKIVFTDDSSHFVSAGEDGLVLLWNISDIVQKQYGYIFRLNANQVSPVYTFSHHALPVTDLHLGAGNMKARLFTVSSDQTCKIYSLSDGQLLLSIVYEYVLSAVTVNALETELFVGTKCGKIQIFHLDPYPRKLEFHVPDDINTNGTLNGHTKTITCLSTSIDGVTLASGSEDEKVYLWNIPSRQLLRSFDMKGPITNLFFHLASSNILSNKFKPELIISKFEKTSQTDDKKMEINVWVQDDLKPLQLANEFESENSNGVHNSYDRYDSNNDGDEAEAMKSEIGKLKEANKQLYQFAMERILKNPLTIGISKSSISADADEV